MLRSNKGIFLARLDTAASFAATLRDAMSKADDIELLIEIWEHNVEAVRAIHKVVVEQDCGFGNRLVTHLPCRSAAAPSQAHHVRFAQPRGLGSR